MLGKRIRHIHRYQEIVNAFIRNGFAFLVMELGLTEMFSIKKKWASEQKLAQKRSLGEKVRSFLEELGPSFVKLGQIASTRPDLIPQEIVKELEKLQDHVQPISFIEVKEIIEAELGNKLEQLFLEFNEEPLASASIGQVHDAVLPSNKRVAVKVQRPNLKTIVETDLEIIGDLARMAENRFAWAANYHLTEIVEEFSNALHQELDYDNEARNAERISRYCEEEPYLVIPKIHWEYSTKKVLTSDYIDGIKISQNKTLDQLGYNRKIIAERFTNIMLKQMLVDGYFHGDPHPGNIVILPNDTIGMLDFGMVGRLNAEIKYHFASLVIAMRHQSTDGILKAITSMGLIEPDTKINELRMDIEDLQEKYYQEALSQIHFGEVINELFSIAFKHIYNFQRT
ncbi:ABC1 kinase family protein [Bacillus chungangensis]|uniref:Ubiquinone biosynthesis protein n=1 Tax=Bacillus chungangensis TaxID=587633 RepID=A0ABT9WW09_9BACI|nr:AarF/ABC1/UbiB kinase family protein [Bacillus chungangensis]MDQ0177402.1 ubiquinone biosynthesis protein [Bacillus chungangensis]